MTNRFDQLFDHPDDELFWGLIQRIEDREWRMERVVELPPPVAVLVRLAFLKTRFDNGGLPYVFECDIPGFGRAIGDALALVGLIDGAEALAGAFDLFPSQADYDDRDRRFATIARRRPEFDRLDAALVPAVEAIEAAACRYVRDHRRDYEYLRTRRPYDPSTDAYDDDADGD